MLYLTLPPIKSPSWHLFYYGFNMLWKCLVQTVTEQEIQWSLASKKWGFDLSKSEREGKSEWERDLRKILTKHRLQNPRQVKKHHLSQEHISTVSECINADKKKGVRDWFFSCSGLLTVHWSSIFMVQPDSLCSLHLITCIYLVQLFLNTDLKHYQIWKRKNH